ncbi:protein big brother [Aplysia californica]|uniref:Protein big brother n=1 Tax=Aplysia californica TaxID=6500 RepID=A0ABM0JEX0_APLCA|nr:protein big brother [Aplysia californica]
MNEGPSDSMLSFVAKTLCCELSEKFTSTMPRVVPDQRATFDNDELFRKLSRESEVRYTGFRDRPLDERQLRFQAECREGHADLAFVGTGTNLQMNFVANSWSESPDDRRLTREFVNFDIEPGKVHLKSQFILNGVCVLWRGWVDLSRLDGVGCLEFDEERAQVEDAFLREQVELRNRQVQERLRIHQQEQQRQAESEAEAVSKRKNRHRVRQTSSTSTNSVTSTDSFPINSSSSRNNSNSGTVDSRRARRSLHHPLHHHHHHQHHRHQGHQRSDPLEHNFLNHHHHHHHSRHHFLHHHLLHRPLHLHQLLHAEQLQHHSKLDIRLAVPRTPTPPPRSPTPPRRSPSPPAKCRSPESPSDRERRSQSKPCPRERTGTE